MNFEDLNEDTCSLPFISFIQKPRHKAWLSEVLDIPPLSGPIYLPQETASPRRTIRLIFIQTYYHAWNKLRMPLYNREG